ncbi:MAG: argininosuccinate lyase, partial [Thermoanaerobaculia bacterium]
LHTGRSRNDQVATDLRLWLKKAAHEAQELVRSCMRVLAERAYEDAATPMPGYTHSKQAEPVTFGHWCLAYVEMLKRDESRFADAITRADECPLGSGALSGTPLAIDRESLAESLGFARPSANSLDAVADRDFAAEYLFTCSLLLSHLSRLSEDLIFFSSDEARYVELPDSFATGSSRMPHKKNPDVLELVRGHAARSIGELTGLLALMKGIPLAYDKDLQLDKEPVFRMRGVIAAALPALTGLIAGLKLHRDRMRTTASNDLLLATELADALAARGVAFREAHEIVGRRLAESLRTGRSLRDLGPNAQITDDDLAALDVDRALAKRTAFGGTAPDRVRDAAKHVLGMARS